jgi:hypothetical protein
MQSDTLTPIQVQAPANDDFMAQILALRRMIAQNKEKSVHDWVISDPDYLQGRHSNEDVAHDIWRARETERKALSPEIQRLIRGGQS